MRRIYSTALCILLILSMLAGCSSSGQGEDDGTSGAAEQEAAAQPGAEETAGLPESAIADTKDMDALYGFINQEIVALPREDFDSWDIRFFDLTGNGSDEAVLICSNNGVLYEKIEIVTADSGALSRIPSDIPIAKYSNEAELSDGFLQIVQETGGTGEQFTYLNLYVYNGKGLTPVLEGLYLSHRVSAGGTDFLETGAINGPLRDFEYTLTRHDNITEEDDVMQHQQYTYQEDTLRFQRNDLETKPSDAIGSIALGDLNVGSSYAGGTVKENTLALYNGVADYTFSLAGEFTMEGSLYYNDYFERMIFMPDELLSSQAIDLGGEFGSINPMQGPMGFRNDDELISQLGSVTYDQLLNNPESEVRLVLRAQDYSFWCLIPGQAGGSWTLLEILEIGN